MDLLVPLLIFVGPKLLVTLRALLSFIGFGVRCIIRGKPFRLKSEFSGDLSEYLFLEFSQDSGRRLTSLTST